MQSPEEFLEKPRTHSSLQCSTIDPRDRRSNRRWSRRSIPGKVKLPPHNCRPAWKYAIHKQGGKECRALVRRCRTSGRRTAARGGWQDRCGLGLEEQAKEQKTHTTQKPRPTLPR